MGGADSGRWLREVREGAEASSVGVHLPCIVLSIVYRAPPEQHVREGVPSRHQLGLQPPASAGASGQRWEGWGSLAGVGLAQPPQRHGQGSAFYMWPLAPFPQTAERLEGSSLSLWLSAQLLRPFTPKAASQGTGERAPPPFWVWTPSFLRPDPPPRHPATTHFTSVYCCFSKALLSSNPATREGVLI